MSVFIKICGICSQSDLEQISALQPDAIGFVQWSKSKRYVAPELVGQWSTPKAMKRVGVFVDPSEEELLYAQKKGHLDVLQVHRIEPKWCVDSSQFPDVEFWNAVNPDDQSSLSYAFDFDRYLLDSFDSKTVGGTGKTCNWQRARQQVEALRKPVLLAGGLSPENIQEAIRAVKPWGVDVSSRVEIEPGRKDLSKVASFIAMARSL